MRNSRERRDDDALGQKASLIRLGRNCLCAEDGVRF